MTSDQIAMEDFARGVKNETLYAEMTVAGFNYRHGWQKARRAAEEREDEKKKERERAANPIIVVEAPMPDGPRDLFGNPLS